MQIMTSYFYQIRNFTNNMIPLSTAVGDPKWFHQNKGQNYKGKDKNGVGNGLRAEPFVPNSSCEGLCRGPEYCSTKNPKNCIFLQTYYKQLSNLNINNIIDRAKILSSKIQEVEKFEKEPVIVFIVHEAYNNPCSERGMIQQGFKDNGYEIKEFNGAMA